MARCRARSLSWVLSRAAARRTRAGAGRAVELRVGCAFGYLEVGGGFGSGLDARRIKHSVPSRPRLSAIEFDSHDGTHPISIHSTSVRVAGCDVIKRELAESVAALVLAVDCRADRVRDVDVVDDN